MSVYTNPTNADATTSPMVDADDMDEEDEDKITLEDVNDIFSANPLFAGMWGLVAPDVNVMTETAQTLKAASVADADVRRYINDTDDEAINAVKASIDALREQAANLQKKLFEDTKAALRGDDLTEEREAELKDSFKAARVKVLAFVDSYEKIAFPTGDDGSDEYSALMVLREETPTLRGKSTNYARHQSGDKHNDHVREFVKTNFPNVKVSAKGRISAEATELHREHCADCRARVAGNPVAE